MRVIVLGAEYIFLGRSCTDRSAIRSVFFFSVLALGLISGESATEWTNLTSWPMVTATTWPQRRQLWSQPRREAHLTLTPCLSWPSTTPLQRRHITTPCCLGPSPWQLHPRTDTSTHPHRQVEDQNPHLSSKRGTHTPTMSSIPQGKTTTDFDLEFIPSLPICGIAVDQDVKCG
ncbi:hypothetical protein AVEN_266346-1 [Araneus ventricosus]|uniref:Uncharacterized protein n=1 Tax=Araneus ventricosus TaxID=182803 RepID=A0A4Y2CRT7_ARAVE|nr:hypothetical protein AVEN_266346-1 [Araneus ventricosus]